MPGRTLMRPELSALPRRPLSADAIFGEETGASATDLSVPGPDCMAELGTLLAEQHMANLKPGIPESGPVPIGRRSAPRLRLRLPAQLVAVDKVQACVLLNISRSGAQVAVHDALREGEGAILRCSNLDHFAIVKRSESGLNALAFDEPVTDAIVLQIRHDQETFAERERRALKETARKWVTGTIDHDRPI